MIAFEDLAQAADDAAIKALDIAAFGDRDVVNLIMQRSEIIGDAEGAGRIVKDWSGGNEAPVMALVDSMGDVLIRRAAAVIWLEYQMLKPVLAEIAPKAIADIGCGYAIFDLFAWRDHPCNLVLIDLEESESRHFGYKDSGAAYSNLDVARKFLTDNGVKKTQITCINPGAKDLSKTRRVDLAVSFLSCGFHYPVDTYMPYFRSNLTKSGAVILDVRQRRARLAGELLSELGTVSVLGEAAEGNARRLMMRKGGQVVGS